MSMVCGYDEPAFQSPPATQLTNLTRGASRRTESSRLEHKEGGDGVRGTCRIQAGREDYLTDPRALPTSTTPTQGSKFGQKSSVLKHPGITTFFPSRFATDLAFSFEPPPFSIQTCRSWRAPGDSTYYTLLSFRTHVAFRPSHDLLTTHGAASDGVRIGRWRINVARFVSGEQKKRTLFAALREDVLAGSEKGSHAQAPENVRLESDTAATPCKSSPECSAVDQIPVRRSSYPRAAGFLDARKAEGRHEVKESRACDRIRSYRDVQEYSVRRTTVDEASAFVLCNQTNTTVLRKTSQRGMGAGDEGENEGETYEER
ncbi:hypothetical protein C8R45DRAFT_938629 [Mycena sanguinolenta]|nr:hypothetical protein C8R45DRAFT_938629 [Mycena sanguinolenta]